VVLAPPLPEVLVVAGGADEADPQAASSPAAAKPSIVDRRRNTLRSIRRVPRSNTSPGCPAIASLLLYRHASRRRCASPSPTNPSPPTDPTTVEPVMTRGGRTQAVDLFRGEKLNYGLYQVYHNLSRAVNHSCRAKLV